MSFCNQESEVQEHDHNIHVSDLVYFQGGLIF